MQVFKTERKLFWANELKSWLLTFAFAVTFYFGVQFFSPISADNIMVGFVVIFLHKIANIITPYRVIEIGIDTQKDQLKFKLYSPMSGKKIETYELREVRSEVVRHSGLIKFLSSPLTLKVFVTAKDMFKINSRFGFSSKTLASIDKTLKVITTSNATS